MHPWKLMWRLIGICSINLFLPSRGRFLHDFCSSSPLQNSNFQPSAASSSFLLLCIGLCGLGWVDPYQMQFKVAWHILKTGHYGLGFDLSIILSPTQPNSKWDSSLDWNKKNNSFLKLLDFRLMDQGVRMIEHAWNFVHWWAPSRSFHPPPSPWLMGTQVAPTAHKASLMVFNARHPHMSLIFFACVHIPRMEQFIRGSILTPPITNPN